MFNLKGPIQPYCAKHNIYLCEECIKNDPVAKLTYSQRLLYEKYLDMCEVVRIGPSVSELAIALGRSLPSVYKMLERIQKLGIILPPQKKIRDE